MSKLLTIWNYIRHHKYMITLLVFLVVIGFLDENSLIQRAKHRNEISTLNSEIENNLIDIFWIFFHGKIISCNSL